MDARWLMLKSFWLLGGLLLLAACSENDTMQVEYFGYQDCKRKLAAKYEKQGSQPAAADMKAKAECKRQFKR
ncbi:hypothetical protein Rifp1Sym_cj00140 [endosymbiont of Riftia pachyptila (vent Ph05)]|nr:hypothetical protein Rifp1Sym_cj00140 [endosymbiont of Riftia pachyptila (vent Ph05)]